MMNRTARSAIGFLLCLSLMSAACQPITLPPGNGEGAAAAHEVTAAPTHSTSFEPTKYAKIYVYTIEEIENDGRSLLHISYPVTEHEAMNLRMEEVSQQFIEEYRETASANEEAYQDYKKETGKEATSIVTHYWQGLDVYIANERVIFFDLERSIYTGNTGSSCVSGYIFDRVSGAALAIPALFVDESYLNRLAELSRAALAERISKDELASDLGWVEDGTAPTAQNFDNILFREDGTFLVRFDKYQVAAGVEGVVEISLAVDAIADLLKPQIRELLGVEAD